MTAYDKKATALGPILFSVNVEFYVHNQPIFPQLGVCVLFICKFRYICENVTQHLGFVRVFVRACLHGCPSASRSLR